jgi:hypothetical protein
MTFAARLDLQDNKQRPVGEQRTGMGFEAIA